MLVYVTDFDQRLGCLHINLSWFSSESVIVDFGVSLIKAFLIKIEAGPHAI